MASKTPQSMSVDGVDSTSYVRVSLVKSSSASGGVTPLRRLSHEREGMDGWPYEYPFGCENSKEIVATDELCSSRQ